MNQLIRTAERMAAAAFLRSPLKDFIPIGRASMRVTHKRPTDFKKDVATGLFMPVPESVKIVRRDGALVDREETEEVWNLITNAGRIFLHKQGYDSSGLGANGLNYIALSNDAVTENAASTTLSNEIAANGLSRAQGTVTLPTGAGNQTTVDHTFTASGSQSAQKAALFTANVAGTMNHVLGFTQRNLITNDTLQITFTITLG
jgi:hypothetical protein